MHLPSTASLSLAGSSFCGSSTPSSLPLTVSYVHAPPLEQTCTTYHRALACSPPHSRLLTQLLSTLLPPFLPSLSLLSLPPVPSHHLVYSIPPHAKPSQLQSQKKPNPGKYIRTYVRTNMCMYVRMYTRVCHACTCVHAHR